MNNIFEEFTNQYQLSKTLRFELKPVGKTLENIERNGIIHNDEQKAIEYEKIKKIIDRYHKAFISMCLKGLTIKLHSDDKRDSLEEYVKYASIAKRSEEEEEQFDTIKNNLRKKIVKAFQDGGSYSDLFKKELIQKHLPEFVKDTEEQKMIKNFSKFTTYFTGFHENRKNMYSEEAKNTAIAYRLIHENLPMFLDNIKSFTKIAESDVAEYFADIELAFENYLNVEHLNEMFSLDNFTNTLTQEQIAVYNNIIGGKTEEDGRKIQGINEYVNLYNQTHKDNRLPLLKPLYKMILSDRVALSWLPDAFESDKEMIDAINSVYNNLTSVLYGKDGKDLETLLTHIDDYDTEHIYIANDLGLTDISQQIFGQYDVYTSAIKTDIREKIKQTPKEKKDPDLFNERINKLFKDRKSFSIAELNSYVEADKTIQSYYAKLGAYDRNGEQKESIFCQIENAHTKASNILAGTHSGNICQSAEETKIIKDLLDAYKSLQHFIKPLLGNGDESEKDNEFDAKLRAIWAELDTVTPLYNKVRNWLTRKPYSDEKIRLFFDNNGSFLNGWVDSATESDNGTQYGGYLFRRKNSIDEYDYYLGVSANAKLFREFNHVEDSDKSTYERLNYYQLKSNIFYGTLFKGDYNKLSKNVIAAIDEVIKSSGSNPIKNKIQKDRGNKNPKTSTASGYLKFVYKEDKGMYDTILRNANFKKQNESLINAIKETLLSLKNFHSASEYASKNYTLFSEMMTDVDIMLKEKTFSYFHVSQEEMNSALSASNKPLYLFKITNKDLSFAETNEKGLRNAKSRGIDNLHTMYFKALMSGEQSVFDIGSGAVYFREHKLTYTEEQMKKGHHHEELKDKFTYPIISKKRYAFDKFKFHLSITLNYSAPKLGNITPLVNKFIRENNDLHFIGIDRGERHLLYLVVIDSKGNIKEQFSLNEIVNSHNGKAHSTDYKTLLIDREKKRDEERKSWKTIESIKELKEGYLSQVIHKITQLMIKYKAIVVLEDLNSGFKRSRQCVESSVYQQFEKKLIDKLNYLADKSLPADSTGGILHAYQLTNKFTSFRDMRKQNGFLFYIPAWNTSKIDPVTGFVNMLDTRYKSEKEATDFFSNFDSITYNASKDWFEFKFDYNKFGTKAEGTQTHWTLCTYGERIKTYRNKDNNSQWENKRINLTEEFKKVFNEAGIDINGDIKSAIQNLNSKKDLEAILNSMKLMLQMRNSITNSDVDYILSPVADKNGNFYDSRKCVSNLPENADANGAYNIALKGLWAARQIRNSNTDKDNNLTISNKEWLRFVQEKPYLKD